MAEADARGQDRGPRRATVGGPWRSPALAGAMLLFGNLLIFEPAQVYGGNSTFFPLAFGQVLAVMLAPAWLAASALAAAPALLGPPAWRRTWMATLSALAIVAWVDGVLFYHGHGLVDGQSLSAPGGQGSLVLQSVGALLCALLAAATAWRWPAPFARFCWLVVALSWLPVAWVIAHDDKAWRGAPDSDAFAAFSPDRNVLVVLLDAFQSDFFEDILAAEPDLREHLSGFTWFRQAAGVAPTTYLSLPAIHSGRPYLPGASLPDFFGESVVRGSFMSTLAAQGYRAELLNPVMNRCPRRVDCFDDDLLVNGTFGGTVASAALLFDLSLLRSAPSIWRDRAFGNGRLLTTRLLDPEGGHVRSNEVLLRLARVAHAGSAPTLKFLHLFGTHPPAQVLADCAVVPPIAWTRSHAVDQDRCALRRVTALFDRLRAIGTYDRTAVILMADHGTGLTSGGYATMQAAAAPLLMVKPIGARGSLATSEQPVSLLDVPATACALSQACRWPVGSPLGVDDAVRHPPSPFVWYQWEQRFWYLDTVPLRARFLIDGSPWDATAWRRDPSVQSEPSDHLDFDADGDASRFGPGWWAPEHLADGRGFRWLFGPAATLFLDPPAGWKGEIAFDGFALSADPDQWLDLLVDGRPVWHGRWQPRLSVTVPEAVRPHRAFALSVRPSKVAQPANGADPRPLSVAFYRLRLD